jgi:hypothetical protein
MRINFYPIKNFQTGADAAAGGLGAVTPIGIGLGAAQAAVGLVQTITQGARSKRLRKQRRAYQTPDEIYDILNAVESRASSGYSPETLQYITSGADNALSSSLSAATRLGADPNQLSNMLDQRIQASFRLGAENQLENMKNFQGYIDALGLVAENKAAEQKSREEYLRDDLAAAGAGQQAGFQNILGGAQTALNTIAADRTSRLYGQPSEFVNDLPTTIGGVSRTAPASTAPYALPAPGGTIGGSSVPGTPRLSGGGTLGGRTSPNTVIPMSTEQILDLLNKIKIGQ